MEPTKETYLSEIRALLVAATPDDKKCKYVGEELERMVDKVTFWDAKVYEPRGWEHSGLTSQEIIAMHDFNTGGFFRDRVWGHIESLMDGAAEYK